MTTKANTAADVGSNEELSFPGGQFGMVRVVRTAYRNGGGLAVKLIDGTGYPITTLSVNLPECSHLLGDNEFFAKTWSENAEIAEAALASGIFVDTDRTSDDIVNAPIWTFK